MTELVHDLKTKALSSGHALQSVLVMSYSVNCTSPCANGQALFPRELTSTQGQELQLSPWKRPVVKCRDQISSYVVQRGRFQQMMASMNGVLKRGGTGKHCDVSGARGVCLVLRRHCGQSSFKSARLIFSPSRCPRCAEGVMRSAGVGDEAGPVASIGAYTSSKAKPATRSKS